MKQYQYYLMRTSALKNYVQKHILHQDNSNVSNKSQTKQQRNSRQGSIVTRKQRKTDNAQSDTISYVEKDFSHQYAESRNRMYSLPCSLPSLSQQIATQQKKTLNQICIKKTKNKKHYQLMPLKKLQPIRLMKRSSSSSSYLTMASSRRKPTDQLFSQIENIRLVERLLLVQPTKQNSKNEHKMFFKQQNRYKKNIQLSKSVPFKSKKMLYHSKPWLE